MSAAHIGSTAPLVFIHGWAMTPAAWRPVMELLPGGRGGHSGDHIALPLPGHAHAPQAAAATLESWASALAARVPHGSTVVGWSLGALLALELAALQPERVRALVLISATPRFVADADWAYGLDARTVVSFLEGYASAPGATLRRFFALQTLGDAARRTLLPRLEAASQPHPDAAQAALQDGLHLLASSDVRPRLAAIRVPVQLIHGACDALMPLAAANWLATALPQAKLSVLEDCGHAPLLSRPAECAALIQDAHERHT
ncbi:pimeloyl-[acyl-carrier protein] methyl ester esterase [Betaproteobacteria bacterium]|nr:pimeloyl-[acyl-carrier protein] methyl ester esterase [Betaproteobacteria bacterium]